MANFYVGQRVRIKHAAGKAAHLVGTETRIVADTVVPVFLLPAWELDIPNPDLPGRGWCVKKQNASDALEPILYDGHQPVAWSDCLWSPHRQEVAA